jgi:hypothetical protein
MEKKNTGQISGMAGESIYIVDGWGHNLFDFEKTSFFYFN